MGLRKCWPLALTLALGTLLGLLLSTQRPQVVLASGGDRSGESIVATGVVSSVYNPGTKVVTELEAVYLLEYRTGRLMAAVPLPQQVGGTTRVLGPMAERDLVKDFKVPLGSTPKFLMTTVTTQEGWEPLMVFEMTTGQVGAYRLQPPSMTGGAATPALFEMLERKPFSEAIVSP